MEVLERETWRARADAHAARVDVLVADHLQRRRDGVPHPVHDFLFTYYSHRPAQLRRWHPGFGTRLADAPEYDALKGYRDGAVTAEHVRAQRPLVSSVHALLAATRARPASFGCFGLHEWAMVHGAGGAVGASGAGRGGGTRHRRPLRLGPAGTDAVVESHRIACSHFDAFRFFTDSARDLNTLRPGPGDRAAFEQPGCLHGNMDLYKHAFRLSPMVDSGLVADCFELARDIRVLDMRASPYDLADLGFEPVRIETPAGKREYADAQRAFAERAAPLRDRLVAACERLLAVS